MQSRMRRKKPDDTTLVVRSAERVSNHEEHPPAWREPQIRTRRNAGTPLHYVNRAERRIPLTSGDRAV